MAGLEKHLYVHRHRVEHGAAAVSAHRRRPLCAERTVAGLLIALDACADLFKPTECVNYFRTCGYDAG